MQTRPGWYVNGSTAYTWRSNTTLDRPYFFTDDEFVMSDQVDMPNVFAYVLNLGSGPTSRWARNTAGGWRATP